MDPFSLLTTDQATGRATTIIHNNFSQMDDVGVLQSHQKLDLPCGWLGNANVREIDLRASAPHAFTHSLQSNHVSGLFVHSLKHGPIRALPYALCYGIIRDCVYAPRHLRAWHESGMWPSSHVWIRNVSIKSCVNKECEHQVMCE